MLEKIKELRVKADTLPHPPPFFFLHQKKPEKKLNYGRKGKQT